MTCSLDTPCRPRGARRLTARASGPHHVRMPGAATDPHVVIVGGGFGGLHAARALAGRPVRVTLLDRRNHHLFQPLLYQVATAALNAADIATPLRSILRRASNVTVLLADVEKVDLAARRLDLDRGGMSYEARIILVEGGPRVLSAFPETLSQRAERALQKIGVEVRTHAVVTRITPDAVWIGGEQIRARTVLWAAGVAATPLARSLGVPLDRSGRVLVDPDLSIPGHPEAFAIGDMCALTQEGRPLPGLAPVAIQEGRATAANVLRRLAGLPTKAFRYRDKGTMATIGRAAAVAVVGPLKLSGLIAWLAWLFVHIMFLIGFRNRFLVLFEWAWAYVTWHRGARLITRPWRPETGER